MGMTVGMVVRVGVRVRLFDGARVRTLPPFFCFFCTFLTVMFLSGFHWISVPTALVRQSSSSSGSIRYVFAPNAYFEDTTLTKTYLMDPDDDDDCLTKAVGTEIQWKPDKNITVKKVQKKQKKGGKVRTRAPSKSLTLTPTLTTIPTVIPIQGAHAHGRGADRLLLQLLRPAGRARGGRRDGNPHPHPLTLTLTLTLTLSPSPFHPRPLTLALSPSHPLTRLPHPSHSLTLTSHPLLHPCTLTR
jgi:hypothetical protein